MSALRLLIVADDLTGALDAAAPFAGRGLRVEVALHPGAAAAAVATGAEVVAVSTRSREVAPAPARAAVAAALAARPPGAALFKKVDSRLKGNLEAELDAIPFARALMAPAIPDFGRVVRGGAVAGFGVDAPIPVGARLGRHAARCLVPDVATEAEMAAALEGALEGADGADLLVGARGLAEALARRMTGRAEAAASPLPGPRGLFVVGSRDPITLAQVAALRAAGAAVAEAPNGEVGAAPGAPDLLVVQATPGASGAAGGAAGEAVAAALARGVHPRLTAGRDLLLLTGGATAEAVLEAMGVARVRLLGECLPGLPVARAGGLTLVAKSGGFGGADALVRVARMMGAG